jgi:AraC-like DNA-binding protein
MAPLCGLPQLLADHGVDADRFLGSHGCDPDLFDDPDNTITFGGVGRLLADTAASTDCAYPGLALGRPLAADTLGPVGRSMPFAPTVGIALRTLVLNLHLHDQGAVPYLHTSEQEAAFGYAIHCPDAVGTEHIYDLAALIGRNIVAELAGPGWRHDEIRLFRDAPDDKALFREAFTAPVRFSAGQCAIVFPAADLDRPLANANPDRFAAAMRDLESLDEAAGGGFDGKVRRVLLSRLFARTGPNELGFDRDAVAGIFCVHPRTLNRRLRSDGTTFASVLAEARYAVARQLLRDTRIDVQEIALLLGYAGTGPFAEAFRRWSGTTPANWRRQID